MPSTPRDCTSYAASPRPDTAVTVEPSGGLLARPAAKVLGEIPGLVSQSMIDPSSEAVRYSQTRLPELAETVGLYSGMPNSADTSAADRQVVGMVKAACANGGSDAEALAAAERLLDPGGLPVVHPASATVPASTVARTRVNGRGRSCPHGCRVA